MEIDKRFKQTSKEAMVTIILFLVNFVWWAVFGFGLAGSKARVLGLPAWFFMSCIVGYVVFVIASFVIVRFVFKDMSIEAYEKGGQKA